MDLAASAAVAPSIARRCHIGRIVMPSDSIVGLLLRRIALWQAQCQLVSAWQFVLMHCPRQRGSRGLFARCCYLLRFRLLLLLVLMHCLSPQLCLPWRRQRLDA